MTRAWAVLSTLLVTVVPASVHAQSGVGIKGGFSYGNVSNRGLLPGNLSERTGFAVGLGIGNSAKLVGLGVEALYAQRGVSSSTDGASRKLDYLDLPAYVRVTLPTPGIAPYAFAGPQVSFELKCRAGSADCPDAGRPKTTFAGIIGGGARLGAQSAFSIEGRYVYGLTDLKLSTITSSSSYKTRSFMILAGYSF